MLFSEGERYQQDICLSYDPPEHEVWQRSYASEQMRIQHRIAKLYYYSGLYLLHCNELLVFNSYTRKNCD